jgi:hypothetical protein
MSYLVNRISCISGLRPYFSHHLLTVRHNFVSATGLGFEIFLLMSSFFIRMYNARDLWRLCVWAGEDHAV